MQFFSILKGAFPFYLDFHTTDVFQICTGTEQYCIILKKLAKNIGHRVNFRDIFKELTFEGYVLGEFGYHGNKYDVIKCLEGNLNTPVISQSMICLSN